MSAHKTTEESFPGEKHFTEALRLLKAAPPGKRDADAIMTELMQLAEIRANDFHRTNRHSFKAALLDKDAFLSAIMGKFNTVLQSFVVEEQHNPRSLRAYFTSVANNICNNLIKSTAAANRQEVPVVGDVKVRLHNIETPPPTPETRLERIEALPDKVACWAKRHLTKVHVDAVELLGDVVDEPQRGARQKIADKLGISSPTAGSRLHYARRVMQANGLPEHARAFIEDGTDFPTNGNGHGR